MDIGNIILVKHYGINVYTIMVNVLGYDEDYWNNDGLVKKKYHL
jgi:hypothetical protein